MEYDELEAFGYLTATLDKALEDKTGTGLSPLEFDKMCSMPRSHFAVIYKKAHALRAITPEYEEVISHILERIKPGRTDGTSAERLSLEDQGVLILAYHKFDPKLVSADAAASCLGVTRERVYRLLEEGKLTGIKVRGRWKVCRKSVDLRKKEMGIDINL